MMDEKARLELDELHARIAKLKSEKAKLDAETARIHERGIWFVGIAGAVFMIATVLITKYFL